jgi:subtilisin-like proprotein convertase family protein
MSKSKFVILSRSSTFSYWAAFLSDALVIRPAGDWQLKIKDKLPGNNYKELIFPVNSLKLKSEMKLQ